jgi:hypothetical protein
LEVTLYLLLLHQQVEEEADRVIQTQQADQEDLVAVVHIPTVLPPLLVQLDLVILQALHPVKAITVVLELLQAHMVVAVVGEQAVLVFRGLLELAVQQAQV